MRNLHAVLRTPKLTEMFHKIELKRASEVQIRKENQKAYEHWTSLDVSQKNASSFLEIVSNDIHQLLRVRKQESSSSPVSRGHTLRQ